MLLNSGCDHRNDWCSNQKQLSALNRKISISWNMNMTRNHHGKFIISGWCPVSDVCLICKVLWHVKITTSLTVEITVWIQHIKVIGRLTWTNSVDSDMHVHSLTTTAITPRHQTIGSNQPVVMRSFPTIIGILKSSKPHRCLLETKSGVLCQKYVLRAGTSNYIPQVVWGERWDVCCENFEANLPRYNGIALYAFLDKDNLTNMQQMAIATTPYHLHSIMHVYIFVVKLGLVL